MRRMVVTDPLGHLLGFFAAIAVMITLAYSRAYAADPACSGRVLHAGPVLAARHLSVMLAANNFLMIYLGLG